MRNLAAVIFVSFALCGASIGQEISGTVIDLNRESIVGATLHIRNQNTNKESTVATDTRGKFSVRGLVSGSYSLTVRADGFSQTSRVVDLDQSASLEIILKPRRIAEVVSIMAGHLAGTPGALERTAGSIQTIKKEELENSRVFDFSEALRKVAGVSVRNEEGFGLRPNISIRGSNPTRSRKVLLLEDGVPLSYAPYGDNSSYYHPPVERFESIEVLKGSGQIEYGPVTVAGVVNYITPAPTDKPVVSVKVLGGNRDYFNGSSRFSGQFGDTGMVISFSRKQGLGSRENLRSGVNDFSSKIIHQLDGKNILTFKYSHFDESSQLTYSGLTEAEYAANPRQNPFLNDDLEFFREGLSVSHTAIFGSNKTLSTGFYTSYFSRDWWRQSSNSDQRPNRLFSDPDCLGIEDLSTTCGNQGTPRDFRTFGVEPKFNVWFDAGEIRNELNVGFRLHYETQDRRAWNGFTPNAREQGSEITERNLRDTRAISGFILNRFIWKRFSFTPGLRIENVAYQRRNLLNGADAKTSLTQLIPGIGLAFNISNNTTIFAGVHRGFAPPSTSDILTNNGGVVDLESELSWNYEVGIRARPSEAVSFEATFFRNDYENEIIPSSVAGGVGSTQTNAGQTLQQGVEFTTRLDSNRIFDSGYNVYFQTAYAFLGKASFESVRFSSIPGFETVLISGNRLPYAPKHTATSSLGFSYKRFDGFLENVFVGSQFSDDLNTTEPTQNGQRGRIGSQIYFNATANYRVEHWNSTFFVSSKNVFDRLFVVDRTRGIYPSSPRLIQFGWKWSF